jgi:hypothetical protein
MKSLKINPLIKGKFILLLAMSIYACEKDEKIEPQEVVQSEPAEVLDCNAFSSNITLVDHPDRAVDYIIDCYISVNADVIIEPGVVIAFDQNAGIKIADNSASFIAEGTESKPITFTGLKSIKGYWVGIITYNNNPLNLLKHCIVEYGGATKISNKEANIVIYGGGALKIDNCIVRKSAGVGLSANYSTGVFSTSNSVYTENEAPMNIEDKFIGIPNPSDDYTGNVTDRILLRKHTSTISEPTTARKINVPYRFTGGITGVTDALTVEPGVEFEMAAGSGIKVSESNGKGALKMVGTATDSIKIYGMLDVEGAWEYIYFYGQNPLNEIAFTSIENGGQDPLNNHGVVKVYFDALLSIHNVTFKDTKSPACAIAYQLLNGQASNPNLTIADIDLVNTDCESIEW